MRVTRWLTVAAAVGVAAFVSPGVLAQYGSDYGRQTTGAYVDALKTARTHAMYSARAETLRDSIMHLGHVVNCLEGARGKNYDASNGNPCQGQGAGIIPDLDAAMRGYQMGATTALDQARKADELALETLKLTDLTQVKSGATKVADMLGNALRAVGQ